MIRRAQSYSDFYHAVNAYQRKEASLSRKQSLDQLKQAQPAASAEVLFEEEFGRLEQDLLDESHWEYQTYHGQLQLADSHLDNLLRSTASTLDLLSELSNSFQSVEAQTEAFRQQCESLIATQRLKQQPKWSCWRVADSGTWHTTVNGMQLQGSIIVPHPH